MRNLSLDIPGLSGDGFRASIGIDKAQSTRSLYRRGAVLGLQFPQDAVHVGFDRAHTDEQGLADLPIRIAGGHLFQHVHLPIAERFNDEPAIAACR